MNKRLLITLTTAIFLLIATMIAIKLAKGYRPDLKNGSLKATGLLLANSIPRGAQVFINDKLMTATDDTLNLSPDEYEVKIKKTGYLPWHKKIRVQAELVTETNARLFPSVPEMKPLTLAGVSQPLVSPDGSKIFFSSELGFWVLEMVTRPLTNPKPKKISQPEINLVYQKWGKEKEIEDVIRFDKFPLEFQQIATDSAKIVNFSPDETKLLYLAKENVEIPQDLIPKIPSASSQPEERNIKANVLYVYDRKEDRNFKIHEALENISWFPDSRHLLFIRDGKIKIIEYDGQNETIIYAGIFEEDFFAIWPDDSRLVVLTNLNPDSPLLPNLYAINLR